MQKNQLGNQLGVEEGDRAVVVLRKIVEACQERTLVGVMARRLECSAATVYNWRETEREDTALQRLVRIALLKDREFQDMAAVAHDIVVQRIG